MALRLCIASPVLTMIVVVWIAPPEVGSANETTACPEAIVPKFGHTVAEPAPPTKDAELLSVSQTKVRALRTLGNLHSQAMVAACPVEEVMIPTALNAARCRRDLIRRLHSRNRFVLSL